MPSPSSRPLVVLEDDTFISTMMETVLRSRGYAVHVASDTAQALAHLQRLAPADCVLISDVHLPGETGNAFVVRLFREHPELFRRTRFLVVSAAPTLPEEFALLGVGFVQKPFTLPQLLEAVAPLAQDSRPG